MNNKTTNILDVAVSSTTYPQVLRHIDQWIKKEQRHYICVAAVHLIMECQKDHTLRTGVNNASIVTPDGVPLVWLSKLYGNRPVERVYGPTLMIKTCDLAEKKGHRVFIMGGSKGQSIQVVQNLHKQFPQLHIVGNVDTPHRPLTTSQTKKIIQNINASKADIVFIGLGCPLQEQWMIEHRPHINAAVLIGVGAAFNFISGKVAQAPPWMQHHGLEWLFRLIQEPRRLAHRYLIIQSLFVIKICRQLINDFLLR
jgi:N-acetylglucosaminyldiphosphoundecaprenol N-acetyl-beta-D-mannosaminyltransferase